MRNATLFFSLFTMAFFLMSFNASASSELQADSYVVYYGDVNGDGYKDIYLEGVQKYALIASDIVIPIPLPGMFPSYVIWGESGGTFDPDIEARVVSSLDGFSSLDFYFGLFVEDSRELFVRSPLSHVSNVIVGDLDLHNPVLLSQFAKVGDFDFSSQSGFVLTMNDYNGDGVLDLRRENPGFSDIVALNNGGSFDSIVDTTPKYIEENYAPPILNSAPDTDVAKLVGGTPVSGVKVLPTGASGYSLSIQIPPAAGGVQPDLTLQYNSLSTNGLVGQGWGLSGLSSIYRCSTTIAADGIVDGVDYDDNDKFCLDGQRLILISGEVYGQSDTTYRTEVDSYSRITVENSSGGYLPKGLTTKFYPYEPETFIVETKSGLTMEYGVNDESKISLVNGNVHTWLLNKVTDKYGNFYKVSYQTDSSRTQYVPKTIEYNLHDTLNNSSPNTRINFGYESRDDNNISFQFYGEKKLEKRLSSIVTEVKKVSGYEQVKHYKLRYESTSSDNISRLASVQECDGSDLCLPPVTFKWAIENINHATVAINSQSTRMEFQSGGIRAGGSDTSRIRIGEFNGDGKADLFYIASFDGDKKTEFFLSSDDGYKRVASGIQVDNRGIAELHIGGSVPVSVSGIPNAGLSRVYLGDFDGNGLTDIYTVEHYPEQPCLPGSDFTTTKCAQMNYEYQNALATAYDKIHYSYVDHEGEYYSETFTLDFINEISYAWGLSSAGEYADLQRLKFGDFNGDGLTDFIRLQGFTTEEAATVYLAKRGLANRGKFDVIENSNINVIYNYHSVTSGTDTNYQISRFRVGDFNGDGLSDLYQINGLNNVESFGDDQFVADGSEDNIFFSNGSGSFIKKPVKSFRTGVRSSYAQMSYDLSRIRIADFNADRKTDVFVFAKEGESNHKLLLSVGDGSFALKDVSISESIPENIDEASIFIKRFLNSDVNGDGKMDFYRAISGEESENFSASDQIYYSRGDGEFYSQRTSFATVLNNTDDDNTSFDIARIKFLDANGDGVKDVYYTNGDSQSAIQVDDIFISNGVRGNKVSEFKDSLGAKTRVVYKNAADFDGLHWKEQLYPLKSILPSLSLVEKIFRPASTDQEYEYSRLSYNSLESKSVGFGRFEKKDIQRNVVQATDFHQDYPFIGKPKKTQEYIPGYLYTCSDDFSNCNLKYKYVLEAINSKEFVWNSNLLTSKNENRDVQQLYPVKTTSYRYLLNDEVKEIEGKRVKTEVVLGELDVNDVILKSGIDGYGNLKKQTTKTFNIDGSLLKTAILDFEYDINEEDWSITRIKSVTSNSARIGNTAKQLKKIYGYDEHNITNKPNWLVTQPDSDDITQRLVTRLDYDSYGNVSRAINCDRDVAIEDCDFSYLFGRKKRYDYTESAGRLLNEQYNSYNDRTAGNSYDYSFGLAIKSKDINGLESEYKYDSLGRLEQVVNNSVITKLERKWCGIENHCPTIGGQKSYLLEVSQTAGQVPVTQYFDQFNRLIRNETVGFAGALIYQDTQYDQHGRVHKSSEPYYAGQSPIWHTFNYDILDRIQEEIYIDSNGVEQTVHKNYLGNVVTTVDALGNETSIETDDLGLVIRTTDESNVSVSFKYNSQGQLIETKDKNNNIVSMTYDELGRKKTMIDPNLGHWEYLYNGYGELREEISKRSKRDPDAKNISHRYEYDELGRLEHKYVKVGTQLNDYYYYRYDSAEGKGKGQLDYKYVNYHTEGKIYTEQFTYDELGRVAEIEYIHDSNLATSTDGAAFSGSSKTTYDAFNRIASVTYPKGFKLNYNYNVYGYLSKVKNALNDEMIWQANSYSERGQAEWVDLGNGASKLKTFVPETGLLSDAVALSSTGHDIHSLTYTYDARGNVYTRTDNQQNSLMETFGYDGRNRLTSVTTNGGSTPISLKSFVYDDLGNITGKPNLSGNYSYGSCAGPHAVCQAGTRTYNYDLVGNVTKITDSANSSSIDISYTRFNKPKKIGSTSFDYGVDGYRATQTSVEADGKTKTTHYVGNGAEGGTLFEETRHDGITTYKNYIYAVDSEPVSVFSRESEKQSYVEEYYHRDALGSVVAVSDANGELENVVSYDAFGRRRNTNYTFSSDVSSLPEITGNEGFTGHEELPNLGLIHMNGRVYDPEVGRFLSADPYIQSPLNTQSYNRYSYVTNNPVNYVDPTGYMFQTTDPRVIYGNGAGDVSKYSMAQLQANFLTSMQSSINNSHIVNNMVTWLPTSDAVNLGYKLMYSDQSVEVGDYLWAAASFLPAKYIKKGKDSFDAVGELSDSLNVTKKVDTPHTVAHGGNKTAGAPKTNQPNSIHEQIRPDGSRSVTYYDDKGRMFSREDYGQQRTHGVLGRGADGRSVPHEHRVNWSDRGPIGKQYRELDSNGRPVGSWHDD